MKNQNEVALMQSKRIDEIVIGAIGQKNIQGFQKAHIQAIAISDLKELMNADYMKPIMSLQGSKLGFKTDKDPTAKNPNQSGYPMEIVRNCLIEAVFFGLQPTGNQFNILSGDMYPTVEGMTVKLNTWEGLTYSIVNSLPKVSSDGKSAAIDATIKWSLDNIERIEIIPIALKTNEYTSVDAMNGKAKRKAMKWLYEAITGQHIGVSDIEDTNYVDIVDEKSLPSMTENEFEQAKEQIKLGNTTLQNIENMFLLTINQQLELQNIQDAAQN